MSEKDHSSMSESHRPGSVPNILRLLAVSAVRGFGLGVFVAASLAVAARAVDSNLSLEIAVQDVMEVLWPTGLWLMALEAAGSTWDVALVWGAALGSNGLVYAVVCCVLRLVFRIARDN
jgi:NhaP-type Na+/H+ or K+/H+ antiporter